MQFAYSLCLAHLAIEPIRISASLKRAALVLLLSGFCLPSFAYAIRLSYIEAPREDIEIVYSMGSAMLAYDFTVGASDLLVSRIGMFDDYGDGLAQVYNALIWDDAGAVVAETSVPGGTAAPLLDRFRYVDLSSPVRLLAGESYVIGTWQGPDGGSMGRPRAWDPTSQIGFESFGANHTSLQADSLLFPTELTQAGLILGPTLAYSIVPEPATSVLFALGGTITVLTSRWRTRSRNPRPTP